MKRERTKRSFRVLVSAWISRVGGRDTLTGIFRYIAKNPSWQLTIAQNNEEFTPDLVRTAKDKGFDGIIATIPGSEETLSALTETPLPVVIKNVRSQMFGARRGPTTFIYNDNESIGRLAANMFLKNGHYASFAYVPEFDEEWCKERGDSFCARLAENGADCRVFGSEAFPRNPSSDKDRLATFLKGLPKPAAVYASTDQCALHVLEVSSSAGISIPHQMSLLGTDNDEFLTLHTAPPISSILPGHVAMGFKAASELAKLMRGNHAKFKHNSIYISPVSVIERASTRPTLPATTLISNIKAYISAHSCERISVTDVVSHVGVSRSLAEIRFRQIEGKSIRQAIEERRLREAAQLLKKSTLSIKEIAKRCGFSGQNRLSHVFKVRFGLAPKHYRFTAMPMPDTDALLYVLIPFICIMSR